MNKRGFTLVELLAVVVVLAVVSIIAIPITINIIENARKGALEESAKGLMDAANNYYALHGKDITDYVDFSIVNGKQVSSEKLKYKGSIENGYLRLVDAKTMALCIDDEKYYATKTLDSDEIVVDEGICTSEYDEDTLGFVVGGSGNFVGTRLSVKAYNSGSNLPTRGKEGDLAVITSTKITGYMLSPTTPTEAKEGLVWVVLDNSSTNFIVTKTSVIGVAYVAQFINNTWELKEAYIYNNGWAQLTNYDNTEYEWNYDYTGHYEEFTAPLSGYYTIELWGAAGGDALSTVLSGNGAYTKGETYLNVGEKLYVYVGQKGSGNAGGWNGGGGAPTNYSGVNSFGGGGSTDVRTVATSAANKWNEVTSLRTRIMVAAGGGGSSYLSGYSSSTGGAGGGLTGYAGSQGSSYVGPGGGATQIRPGSGNGAGYGYGGTAASYHTNGGGGSGWFGGGGATNYYSGGAGGSSYISGHRGCVSVDEDIHVIGSNNSYTGKYFVNTIMIDGNGYSWTDKKGNYTEMPNYADNSNMVGNRGNGYAKITFKKFSSLTAEEYNTIGANVQNVWLYDYMGYYQVFIAPKAGKYQIELWGAQGGHSYGGLGAYTKGDITLSKGETLYIYVGQQGQGNAGGWNGGGGAPTNYDGVNSYGGGGATDVRITPSNSVTGWSGNDTLKTRIMVAAAGGGGSYLSGYSSSYGGAGGGLEGYEGSQGSSYVGHGYGGTQTAGGTGVAGSFGVGGTAASYHTNGGGGAGWFGGGGATNYYNGGGSGSSYISGHDGCIGVNIDVTPKSNDSVSYTGYKFTNTTIIDGQGYKWTTSKGSLVKMPTYDGEALITGNPYNGYAKITFIS